jgi:DNA-binding NtrC family response regulator
VTVNVAGLDDNLFADTLFGHHKGAFTGADRPRKGLIERAHGGTLFLDEIGDLSQASQVKLLRLLQEGEYYPIGSDEPRHTDARVVVATLADLDADQREGRFRKDLYYRLATHHVHVPPLRDRKEDLPVLLDCFLGRAAESLGKAAPTPPAELFVLLRSYHFPGNVRELEAMVHDAVTVHRGGVLSTATFRQKMGHEGAAPTPSAPEEASEGLRFPEPLPTLKQAEGLLIDEALRRAEGNQRIAAELLGLSRRALNNRLKRSS